jgi:DNA replication and repair protein RecF
VTWQYVTNWGGADLDEAAAMEVALLSALAGGRRKDLERRVTSVGPHRDDPVLIIGGRPARTQASQGEQRTAALALRIAAYRVLREHHGTTPILLLDDVFSELDPGRARGVLELLPGGQVFVTTARDDEPQLTGRPPGGLAGRNWLVAEGSIT